MPSACAGTRPMTLQFDGQAERHFRFEIEDDTPPKLKGWVFELHTDGTETRISELTGSCRAGKSNDGGPRVMDLIFMLDDETIFLAGRVRGRHFDGRFLSFTPETVFNAAKSGALLEPGETGTGGGSQQTFADREGVAADAETSQTSVESATKDE